MWLASNEGGQFAGNFARNVVLFREKEGKKTQKKNVTTTLSESYGSQSTKFAVGVRTRG